MASKNEEQAPQEEKLAIEVLVDSIKAISKGFAQLNQAGMPRAMIRAWLHQKTRVSLTNIDSVLDALEELQTEMLQPLPSR